MLNEDGAPIEGANVHIGYPSHQPSNIRGEHKKGHTDENGYFTFTGTASWKASVSVRQDGFYETLLSPEIHESDSRGNARLKSNVEVEVVLRKIRNPVPMYAGRIKLPFPESIGRFGFDLLERDWVHPHGEGNHVDLWISVDFTYESSDNYELALLWEFEGESNGIQPFQPFEHSRFKSAYEAPLEGYSNSIEWIRSRLPNKSATRRVGEPRVLIRNDTEDDSDVLMAKSGYFIRFRSILNEDGEVEGGYYGKIYGAGSFFVGLDEDSSGEMFTGVIYVNPREGGRNIEFDLDKNLLEGLPRDLQPRFP
ncbi:MAG: carboxypeptidase regulatory-like domain-containing protein [Puniceicoccaceae bacterium]|nr:MAG: carboxypeptidase regulatory-like domain-containing protein [Puniceicoccaceae bacterium]